MSSFWTDGAVREALGLKGKADTGPYHAVSTDTRAIEKGDLFVALVGDKFDGHDFLAQAAKAGATGLVVSRKDTKAPKGVTLYEVEDTLAALQNLARYRREKHPARFIGVVGSNGKTTTKELIKAVASTRFRTVATKANLNNQIGVPLTILGLPDDTQIAVVEMGTDRPGEIAALTDVVRPDIVVITSIGEEHLELLGDLEGVLEEETSVLQGLKRDGLAFVAEAPDTLPRKVREIIGRSHTRVAGFGGIAELRPDGGDRHIRFMEDGSTLWRWRGIDVRLPIPGKLNIRNALLALGIGMELGIPAGESARSLTEVKLPGLRGEWIKFGDLHVLADCYNANPPSVEAAIELLGSLPARGRRIAVLGTMRELGESSEALHTSVADRIAKQMGDQIDSVIATGEFAAAFKPHKAKLGKQLVLAEDPIEAFDKVSGDLLPTDTILLKASRGDAMERWLPLLEEQFGKREGGEG